MKDAEHAVGGLGGCGAGDSRAGDGLLGQGASAGSRTVLMPASWADGYPTLAAIKEHAEVIVRGRVTAISGQGEFNNAGTTTDPTKAAPAPYTDFTFAVAAIIKGNVTAGDITIRQTGGTMADGAIEVVEDDPVLEVGDQDVLFLRQFSPGHFFVMGGPAGRFPISNGRTVSTMPGTSIVTPPPADLTQFIAAVKGS